MTARAFDTHKSHNAEFGGWYYLYIFYIVPITDTTRSKRTLNVRSSFALYINNEKRVVHARRDDKYTIIRTSVLSAVAVVACFFDRDCIGEDKTHTLRSKVSMFYLVRYGFTNFVRHTRTVSTRMDRAGDVNSLGPAPPALTSSVRSAYYKNSPITWLLPRIMYTHITHKYIICASDVLSAVRCVLKIKTGAVDGS